MMVRIFLRSNQIFTNEYENFSEKRGGTRKNHGIPAATAKFIIDFLDLISETYGLPDPGKHQSKPGYGLNVCLPHELNKTKFYSMYTSEMDRKENEKVSYPSFIKIWKEVRPFLRILTLRSDMCSTCSRYQALIRHKLLTSPAGGSTDIDEAIENFRKHREEARTAREFYDENRKIALE